MANRTGAQIFQRLSETPSAARNCQKLLFLQSCYSPYEQPWKIISLPKSYNIPVLTLSKKVPIKLWPVLNCYDQSLSCDPITSNPKHRALLDPAGDQQPPSGECLSEPENPQTPTFPALRGSLNNDKSWADTLQARPFAYWEMQRHPK